MPELLKDIIALVFTPVVVVGALAYILRNLFSQALNRDLEQFKARLQSEREHSTAELQKELQAQLFEYQMRFSFFHNKTAEVTGTTYELLAEAVEVISHAVGDHPGDFGARPPETTSVNQARDAHNKLASYYLKHRYILSEGICDKMDEILKAMREVLSKSYYVASDQTDENERFWREAWQSTRLEVPRLKKEIEEQFRRSFAIETRKGA